VGNGGGRLAAVLLAVLLSCSLLLSACAPDVGTVIRSIGKIGQEKPTATNTLIGSVAYAEAISGAIRSGADKVTLNVVASESELKNISENIDPFWGVPVSYLVKSDWNDIEVEGTGSAISVKTVEFTLEQSVSYYVYNAYMRDNADGAAGSVSSGAAGSASSGTPAGAGSTGADSTASAVGADADESAPAAEPPQKIASDVEALNEALPNIISEIMGTKRMAAAASGATENYDYDCALAVHDWLVGNIAYASNMDESSDKNSVAGALIGRSTMCQGYSEAFELLMRCISDTDVRMVVGEGKSEMGADWVDHAWNLANLGGEWYQIDATFDDPVNNSSDRVSHIYFGRCDAGITVDHRWNGEYWPPAAGEDFLYYRSENLFAKNKKEFRKIVKRKLKKGKPAELEIAVNSTKLKEHDLQFIYDSFSKIENIMYSFTVLGEVTLVNLQLEY
jgi:hypothetical protein